MSLSAGVDGGQVFHIIAGKEEGGSHGCCCCIKFKVFCVVLSCSVVLEEG